MANTVRAADVSAYILAQTGPMEQIKLQKLLYYCQAASLAWYGVPLFKERIEAWKNGPVVPQIWNLHRYEYKISAEPSGKANALDQDAQKVVDAILKAYGHLLSYQLVQMTHGEEPWKMARFGRDDLERSNEPLDLDLMRSYYKKIWS